MLAPRRLTSEDRAWIEPLLPGRDPRVVAPAGLPIIPVADTRLDGNEMTYVSECVRSGWISSAGPFVERFENAFAAAVGCEHAVACANGTVALHLTLAALGLGPGDEVIVPAFTMIATANAVRYTGARPVLIDADPRTWNLDPEQLEEAITTRTRAIIVVHTYGRPADMEAIRSVADRHGLAVIEDAAEAHGASYRGRPVGSLGDAATFSFYANKIVTTGEGGMVTTNDRDLAALARRLRDHAFSPERHFWHEYLGFNYRMTGLQAAVGLAQTERLHVLAERRRATARQYLRRLADLAGLTLPGEDDDSRNVFWMFGLLVEDDFALDRDGLRHWLARRGVETRTFFIPIHMQPIYAAECRDRRHPVAERLCRRGLYLPSGPGLKEADIDRVADALIEAARGRRAVA